MGRIPDEEIGRIKKEVGVAELARRRGIELKQHGKDLIGLCPFHSDQLPSLVITPSKNLWHCLGACRQGGDVIAWVMKAEAVSFRHAVEIIKRADVAAIAAGAPASSPTRGSARVKSTVLKLPCPIPLDADDSNALRSAVNFYHETLKESAEAAYLDKRKINRPDAVETFKLGYANRTLGLRLPDGNRAAGAKLRDRLQRVGIYRATGREHFNGSLVIPVFDEQGTVTEMYGRKISDKLRKGTPKHLYLPGAHKGVWNIQALAASHEVILCESLIDALTFWCHGYKNVTASYGIEGFTPDHLDAFKRYNIERVTIAYDRDGPEKDYAGEKAAAKLAPELIEHGFEVFRVDFPEGHDVNSFACMLDDPADALGQLLQGAAWIGKGKTSAGAQQMAAKEKIQPEPSAPAPTAPDETTASAGTPAAAPAQDLPPFVPPPSAAPESDESAAATGQTAEAAAATSAGQLDETFDARAWRIRDIDKNYSYNVLKVNVRVSYGERYHMETIDLANANHRARFLKAAVAETTLAGEILKDDMRKLLLKIEEIQDAVIQNKLKPPEPAINMTPAERDTALAFLKSPDLLDRIAADFETCGIVGERANLLLGYIAAVSRKLDTPLGLLIQSSSAAGKTALMDAVLSFMPDEDVVKLSAMTGQALFYLDDVDLRHKILAVAEEAGSEKADYAIKLLISDGKLSIASTMKDQKTGKLTARQIERPGPVMHMTSTTAHTLNEEKSNRMLILTVNEDREQTRRIHELQRQAQTPGGLIGRQTRETVRRRHQNAQRLLRPLRVVMPDDLARRLSFPDTCLRMRRDHMKYLTIINAVALLRQHQRPVKEITRGNETVTYIEATPADISAANKLADEVLGRSLDEMSPQSRRLLELIDKMAEERRAQNGKTRADFRFTRRDVREYTNWTSTQIHRHLKQLEDLEYVLLHRGARGMSFEYELLYDGRGRNGRKFCMGLIDVSDDKTSPDYVYDEDLCGEKGGYCGPIPTQFHSNSIGIPTPKIGAMLTHMESSKALFRNWAKTQLKGRGKTVVLSS